MTLEPCSHHGRTPPCADAVVAAGVARVVVGAHDPNPAVDGRGLERLRAAGIEVELLDDVAARRQNEAWRVWKSLDRPFVTYKAAVTLDERVTVPGRRWVSGEESRRRVHELRAASDAVAVGMGTVRADAPRLDARDVGAARQPRRLAFGRGPLPEGSELELRSGPLEEELRALAADGVQSLLLEGGPTLATAFLEAGLVDKLLCSSRPSSRARGRLSSAIWRRRWSSSTFGRSPREKTSCWRRTCASRNLGRMFTGIVRELGTVDAFDGSRLVVAAPETAAAAAVGDSVAVAGVCLTVVASEDGRLAFDAVPETLSRTALGSLEPGGPVNVEPSLRVGDPLGGHVVQGHVDAVGRVRSVTPEETAAACGSTRPRRSSATASRRARSRSTASPSRSPPSTTTASRSR